MVSMQGKENKVKLGVKKWVVTATHIFLNLLVEQINLTKTYVDDRVFYTLRFLKL